MVRKQNNQESFRRSHPDFSYFIDKAFWVMLVAICSYGTSTLSKMNESVTNLNVKLAVVVSSIEKHDGDIKNLYEAIKIDQTRIYNLEMGNRK